MYINNSELLLVIGDMKKCIGLCKNIGTAKLLNFNYLIGAYCIFY